MLYLVPQFYIIKGLYYLIKNIDIFEDRKSAVKHFIWVNILLLVASVLCLIFINSFTILLYFLIHIILINSPLNLSLEMGRIYENN